MAEYRPKNRGLERVLGTGALFATAYGNVGSSIYYALGLVAIYAAGDDAGRLPDRRPDLRRHRRHLHRGDDDVPGGRRLLELRAPRVQRVLVLLRGLGPDAHLHHHGLDLGVLRAALPRRLLGAAGRVAGGHHRRHRGRGHAGASLNVVGVKESAGVNIFFAVADFCTQVLLVVVGVVLVLDPDLLVRQIDFGTTPTVGDFLIAIPVGMVAYTGIETISNMAEEARDYGKTIPRGMGLVVVAVFVIYAFLPAVALSAMPVEDGETALALSKEEGGYADDPILGVVQNMDLGALQGAAEIYVGILAATILFIATNAGLLGVSRLTYSMGQYRQLPERLRTLHPQVRHAVRRDRDLRRARLPGDRPRPGRLPRRRSTRSARCSRSRWPTPRWCGCASSSPITSGRGTGPGSDPRRRPRAAAVRGRRRAWAPASRSWSSRCSTCACWSPASSGWRIGIVDLRPLPAPPGAAADRDAQGRRAQAGGRARGRVRVGPGRLRGGPLLAPRRSRRRSRLAARRRRGIHVLVTITVPPNAPIDAALPEQEASAPVGDRLGARARRAAGDRALGEGAPGQAGRRIVEEAREIDARAIVMALPPRRTGHVAVRPDGRDGARRASLPRDHRLHRRRARRARRASVSAARRPWHRPTISACSVLTCVDARASARPARARRGDGRAARSRAAAARSRSATVLGVRSRSSAPGGCGSPARRAGRRRR